MAKNKSDIDIQEKDTKTKPKKTRKVEPLDEVKVVEDDVKVNDVQVDVEIDLRSYNHSDVVNGYIRRKRCI